MKNGTDAKGVPASKDIPRDPRIDPRRGDAVSGPGGRRYVADLMEYSDGSATVIYSRKINAMRAKHMTPRTFWREWAKNGEILQTSEGKSNLDEGGKP